MKKIMILSALLILTGFGLYAQTAEKTPAAASDNAPAPLAVTHWTLDEVKAFEAKLEGDPATTSENPLMTIMKLNDAETVRRTSFGKSGIAEVHMKYTDIFCILNGECEFLIGGEVEGVTSTNPDEVRAGSIKGGERKKAGQGDIIVIPPGIAHQIFVEPDHRVSFMVVKIAQE